MKRRNINQFALVILFWGWMLGCSPTEGPDHAEGTQFGTSCRLTNGAAGRCGTITVPENRLVEDGRQLDLYVMVLPALSNQQQEDPLFLLAGGPGQSAVDAFGPLMPLFEEVRRSREIVLVDQRGTGQSNPLSCAAFERNDLPLDATLDASLDTMSECVTELASVADLTQYTTDVAAHDLDAVREGLGYETINLYGVSYGTRLALTYAGLYPGRARALVLDAVAPAELVLYQQMPVDGQAALDLLFARCAADRDCENAFGDIEAKLNEIIDRLEPPIATEVKDPQTGERLTIDLSADMLMQSIYNLLYSTDLVALLPLLISEAAETGNYTPILTQALILGDQNGVSQELFYAVACAEDAPLIDPDVAAANHAQAESVFPLFAADILALCAVWPETTPAFDWRTIPPVSAPTLLLSGEADPVTPPHYAETLRADMPNATHVVVPEHGHGVFLARCVFDLMEEFIDTAAFGTLNLTCVQEAKPTSFFIDFAGPNP